MIAHFPRYVQNPNSSPSKMIRVENEDQFKRINPQDYKRWQDELTGDPTHGRGAFVASQTADQERERCAVVAETFPEGGKTGGKPTKIGVLIAAAIRGLTSDLFPKVLRNPESSPVKGGDFTEPGAKPETFIRKDATVHDAVEEADARANGFTVLVSDESLPGVAQAPVPLKDPSKQPPQNAPSGQDVSHFPKLLRDPNTEEKPGGMHTELRDGRYARPDVSVANPAQEANAKGNGYTIVVDRK